MYCLPLINIYRKEIHLCIVIFIFIVLKDTIIIREIIKDVQKDNSKCYIK